MPSDPRRGVRDATAAAAAYLAFTIALTWPLARGLAHDVPSDLGDPLLNCWILAWDADHLLRAAAGHAGALAGYWHANIFYPHPYALAYSEHLTAQAVQILPVYALTKNPLLCYNLIFLSTFVLSGLGMYLLARELTSNRGAAFVAGLAYAFAPYRFGSIPHVQVLSSAWMPLVLLGLRRFFDTRKPVHLAAAAAAWTAQNLSCSYYLIFFSPIVILYVAWELTTRRQWRDGRTIAALAVAFAVVVFVTTPFVLPYIRLRALGFMPRSIEETRRFSANVYSYLTAHPELRLWGAWMRAAPRLEGTLFPGLTIVVLAAIAVVAEWRDARLKARATAADAGSANVARGFSRAVGIALIGSSLVAVAMLFGWSLHQPFFKITSFDRVLIVCAALAVLLSIVSPQARVAARSWLSHPVGMLAVLTLFAAAMSLGPDVRAGTRLVEDTNVYALFYNYVPGFDGLRVPARYGMIVALGLATLTAYGVTCLHRLTPPSSRVVTVVAGALIVIESIAVPLPVNGNDTNYKQSNLAPLPPFVGLEDATPPVYRFLAQLPASSAVLELPFGEPAFDVRYVFYSTFHKQPLVNGYSGGAPAEYGLLVEALKDMLRDPERAWTALATSGAQYVIVHESGYLDEIGTMVSGWLRRHGARDVASYGSDRVFALRQRAS